MLLIQTIKWNKLHIMQRAADHAGLDEASVVTLAIIGNRTAFEELVRRRQSWLRTLLQRMSGDHHLADDLSQQVFLQAWRGIRGLKSSQAFAGWLKRLAVNTWLQQLRKKEPLDFADYNNTMEDAGHRTVQDTPGEGIDIDRALAILPDHVRLCIVLSYNEGMSHREIANLTSLPLGTVKSHITRGTRQLQEFLYAYNKG